MSSQKTQGGLHKWVGNDSPKREEFNENFQKLESDMAENQTLANTAKQKADAMASGSPKGVYATLTALQTAFPTGTTGAYLVTADGKWYYWNGSEWTIGGIYQSTGIADDTITQKKIKSSYDNVDTIIALDNTVEDGSFYFSGGKIVFNVNGNTSYKRMVIDTFSINGNDLVIPFNKDANISFSVTLSNTSSKDGTDTSNYNLSWQNVLDNNWGNYYGKYVSGDYFFTLDIAKLKTNSSNYRYLFVTMGVFANYKNPFTFTKGVNTKKVLQWLEVAEDNLNNDLKTKINRYIPDTTFLFNTPVSIYPRKILFIGDSLTQGHIAGYSPAHFEDGINYPSYFMRKIGATGVNAGVSGITPQNWYLNEKGKYTYTDYDTVFIFLGQNGTLTNNVSGANTNDQTGYYCSIIEYIKTQNPNIKIVLLGILEPYYDNFVKAIATYYSLPYLDIYGQTYYNIRRRSGDSVSIYHPSTSDYVHFSRIGYCVLAEIVYLLLGQKILEMPIYFDGTYT